MQIPTHLIVLAVLNDVDVFLGMFRIYLTDLFLYPLHHLIQEAHLGLSFTVHGANTSYNGLITFIILLARCQND